MRDLNGASWTRTGCDRMTGCSQGLASRWRARIHQISQSARRAAEFRTVTVVGGMIPGLQISPVLTAVIKAGPSGVDARSNLKG